MGRKSLPFSCNLAGVKGLDRKHRVCRPLAERDALGLLAAALTDANRPAHVLLKLAPLTGRNATHRAAAAVG
jgi:hypothetical protein